MYSFPLRWFVPVALAAVMPMASAQTSSQPTTPDVKNTASSAGTLSYRSAFADYRAYSEQPVVSWVDANEQVGKIGGWRVYSKEAHQSDDAPAPVPGHQGAKP